MKFLDYIQVNPTIKLEKDKQYPFVEMANADVFAREPKQIDIKKYSSGVKFQRGDTVIARIEPCLQNGKGFFVKNISEGFGSTEFLVFRPKDDKVTNEFLYYFMLTDYIRKSMINSMTGATGRQRVNKDIFKSLELSLPSVEKQKRIADILSAYDDLIENNQKQIKLLEEAAMRLYKEWFVKLRFPGYENSKIVDGVPEGWRLGRVSELAEFKRGKTITKKNAKDGNVPVVAGGLEPAYFHNVANTVAPVITISASGANAGYTRLYNTDIWASDCSYIDASYGDKLYFIYTFLKNNKEVIDNLQRGAAQPHVYAKDINALSTYIPESTIMEPFCNLVAPLFKKIAVQERLISELKQARDKLLPKLMSGEIEV